MKLENLYYESCEATSVLQVSCTVKPLNCGHHGTTAVCQDYRGICISEASGIFLVVWCILELSLAVRLRERLT